MKLLSKKTGEIVDFDIYLHTVIIKPIKVDTYEDREITLKLLCDEFEDYKPKEPLIKDEELRNTIRTWAKKHGIDTVVFDAHWNSFTLGDISITVWGDLPLRSKGLYNITELCGEEE